MVNYIIVGAGITGAVIARHIAERGDKVVVMDKRNHIAGNMYDYVDNNGIRIQKYGPHIFHTDNERVYNYIMRFSRWNDFRLECMVYMNGKYTPSPFNFQTIDDFFSDEKAKEIKAHIHSAYGEAKKTTIIEMLDSKDEIIREYAEFLFNNDYSLYTAKQWGIKPSEIDKSVLKRVPVLFSYKSGYFDDKYQCMPVNGFTAFIAKILDHKNIALQLNTDASDVISISDGKLLVNNMKSEVTVFYTGAVDELLHYKYGVLPYRSLRFEYMTKKTDNYQQAPVVAYPQAEGYTRITEYSKLPIQITNGKTVIAVEYSQLYRRGENEPYYPIPTADSATLYEKYRSELKHIPGLYLCGRLGDYKYYNMDQALARALDICDQIG